MTFNIYTIHELNMNTKMLTSVHGWQWCNFKKTGARELLLKIIAIVAMLHIIETCYRYNILQTFFDETSEHVSAESHSLQYEYAVLHRRQYGFIGFFPNSLMGRVANVPLQDAVDVVKNYMRFLQKDLPAYTSQTWKDMSVSLGRRWSPHSVYTNVRENRRSILSLAKEQLGIEESVGCQSRQNQEIQSKFLDDTTLDGDSGSIEENDLSFNSISDTDKARKTDKFQLVLSKENWENIKPIVRGDGEKPCLAPRVWPNVIAITFWEQHKLPCAFVFKRADVKLSADGQCMIAIRGRCKSVACGNVFIGKACKNMSQDGGIIVDVDTRNTKGDMHEQIKRPLNGKRRKEVAKELVAEGCSGWVKRAARENMEMGDPVPPFLSSNDVLRQARRERTDFELNVQPHDARDLIRAIEQLAGTVEYAGLIQAVGSMPFYAFYGSPAQLHVYNEYCRIHKEASVINLDATGSLVQKLMRPDNRTTGHVFLYSVVINFQNSTIPVYQMLSEKHHMEFIQYWLQSWLRLGARKPKEAVCDYSRALITGISMAFNNITIKSYVNACFASAQGNPYSIATFIRIDVAHLIHMVCRWKSLKHLRQSAIKDFYVRCVALMIECQTLAHFSEIFSLVCAVGAQEYDDSTVGLSPEQTVRESRKKLERYIAVRNIDVGYKEQISDSTEDPSSSSECSSSASTPIEQWVEEKMTRAQKVIRVGVELNAFYLPDFVQQLSKLVKEFPLWTSVTLPYEAPRATSSYVEGYFNDLKTRVLKNSNRPMRVDKFIKKHANDITGATILFCSKLVNFEKRGGSVPVQPLKNVVAIKRTLSNEPLPITNKANDSDLMSKENWRAKATIREMPYDNDDRSITVSEDLNRSQSLIGREMSPSPLCSVTLTDQRIRDIQLDHLYHKTSEAQFNLNDISPIESAEKENSETSKMQTDQRVELGKIHHLDAQTRNIDVANRTHLSEETPISTNSTSKAVKSENPRSKYFKAFPEIRHVNVLNKKTMKPSFLRNGSVCRRPLSIDGSTLFVEFTCGFDSLASILMIGAVDDLHYAFFLEQSDTPILRFVSSIINSGITISTLRDRAVILKSFHTPIATRVTNNRVKSYTINAWDSIVNIVNNTLRAQPSVWETQTCAVCPRRQITVPCITVNHRIICREGFGSLEKAISFRSNIYNMQCYEPCTARYTLQRTPNIHLFIELDIRTEMPISKSGMQCRLEQLPAILRLILDEELEVEYKLVGVIAYKNRHFTGFCRRNNGNWQKYDDLQENVLSANPRTEIEPHLAVYTRAYGDKCDATECPCNKCHE